ncbi:MAG: apolipoprotein N-acyltransferase [Steroidobacteraceae bacterium]
MKPAISPLVETLRTPSALSSWLSRHALWFAFVVGATMALAFAPMGVWPLAMVCPAWLFLAWQDVTPKRAAAIGFWFHSGTFLAGTYWLYHSVHTIGGAPIWVAMLLMLALVAIMGAYLALLGYAQARLLPASGLLRWLVGLPMLWVLLEWWRGWFLSGFPWLSLGYAQIDSPLAGLAPLFGVYGVTLVCVVSAGALVSVLLGNSRQRVIALAALTLPWLSAWLLWQHEWTQKIDAPVSVAVVQASVPQDHKWSPEWRDKTLALYRQLATPHFGKQLIVWPEAALPDLAHQLTDYLSALWSEAHAANSDVVMGLLHFDAGKDAYYNGVLALADDVQWYHKRHLVPFAEFFPVPSFVRSWLRLMSLPYSDFNAGDVQQPALSAAGQKLGITICYEDGFGSEQLSVLKQATLLVNVTNDAWFGDSSAPPQHLEISRMRALEGGRDMVRAANDGISALISADGKVMATLPRFKVAVLTGTVQPRTGLTPYARVGNWPVLLLCLLGSLLAMLSVYRVGHANFTETQE